MADMYKPVGLTKAVGLLPKSDRRQRVEGRCWLGAALRSPESFETLIRQERFSEKTYTKIGRSYIRAVPISPGPFENI